MENEMDPADRASRGRRIFESLRRSTESDDAVDSTSAGSGRSPGSDHEDTMASASSSPPPAGDDGEGDAEHDAEHDHRAEHHGAAPPPAGDEPDVPAAPESSPPAAGGTSAPAGSFPGVADLPTELSPPPPSPDDGTEPTAMDSSAGERPVPRVVAVANQKGGVGKTTTAVNLGAALTELGFRVLVVDLDPQGNATTGLGIDIRNLDTTVYDSLMSDAPLEDSVEATSVRNLFVVPSNMDLAGAEIELVPMFSRELKLRRAVEAVKDEYDYVLIDCPPSLGLLTVNGLAASDDVIVPIQCEYYALEGLGQLVNNVDLVRTNLNPVLDIRGIVLTMYDARTKLADQVVNEVRAHFGSKVYATIVPRTVRLSEAPSFGQPIIVFDPSSRGAEAYRALAREMSGRMEPQPS